MDTSDLERRARQYTDGLKITITNQLGSGTDGAVWRTNRQTAVKSFHYPHNYRSELACYQRLQELDVTEIRGFAIPRLVGHDDYLRVVEMDIVTPPFILDFGKVYIDSAPEHTPEVMADWERDQQELWEERWAEVQTILWALRRLGIYYQDPKPGNIQFAREP